MKEVFFTDQKLSALKNVLNQPYRSNYFGLGLCVSGSATLVSNLDEQRVEPNAVIAMPPQVIKQWKNVSDDFNTLTVFFTKAFFTGTFANQNYLEQFGFFDPNSPHVHRLSAGEARRLTALFQNIKTAAAREHPYQHQMLYGYIHVLLFEFQTLYEQLHLRTTYSPNRQQQLAAAFKALANAHFQNERRVQFYAERLFITAKHLTEILKAETGKTASDWLSDLLVLEAKVLLSTPQLQVAQIAEQLHFPDASTFGKFFKKHTGSSPLSYRKNV